MATKKQPAPSATDAAAIFKPFNPNDPGRPEIVIAPSLLSSNFAHEAQELAKCRRARAPWIHADIMDGHFVPNITFGPPLLKAWTKADPGLFYDVHLMIENPMNYAEAFVQAGANLINIHAETTQQLKRDLRAIHRMGVKAGVTIKPKTPVSAIANILGEVDMVLVMTVEPGFGGQKMIAKTLNKIRELDLIRRQEKLAFRLQADGGINAETAPIVAAAGADVLVAGNAVFQGGDVKGNLTAMRKSLAQAGHKNAR